MDADNEAKLGEIQGNYTTEKFKAAYSARAAAESFAPASFR